MRCFRALVVGASVWAGALGFEPACAADAELEAAARKALRKAATYYREKVATRGGYVYYYSLDLRQRWGEGVADLSTIFVQPPGTPTVGMAYLSAHAATGERYYLDAAREAAEALVYGQLDSGGWTQTIHFGPARRRGKYRNGQGGDWNASSLDDGQTQAALTLLMRADEALEFRQAAIHEAAAYGLDALLKAQFPNGAFPQVWTGAVQPKPIVRAHYPDYDWKTEGRLKNYWDHYTLNDNLAGNVADALITAHRVYQDPRYLAALVRLGDFLLLAQMPAPQPAWCQQYNDAMVPIWARRFEPPAIASWESQDVLETLIRIAVYTGQPKYLQPIPRALEYLEGCLLPDGRLARYYELKTNRPLYMDQRYQLTYDDSVVPRHYGWKQTSRLAAIARQYHEAAGALKRAGVARKRSASKARDLAESTAASQDPEKLQERVRRILAELDAQGRWVSTYAGEALVGQPRFPPSFRYLSSAVFSQNVELLSRYLARVEP